MGRTYDNITLRGAEQAAVVAYLNDIEFNAFVAPTENDLTVVYTQPQDHYIAGQISQQVHCVALLVDVFDGDAFAYQLYEDGVLTDQYEDSPGTFYAIDEARFEFHEHATKICTAFGGLSRQEEVNDALLGILRLSLNKSPRTSAIWPHEALMRTLNLPWWAGDVTYDHVSWGQRLEGPSAMKIFWSRFVETAPHNHYRSAHKQS